MQFRYAAALPALIWSSIASGAPETALQPIDNWAVDYGATQCTAARTFGTATSPIIFGLVPSLTGNSFQLLVNVPQAGPVYAKESRGTINFGDGAIQSGVLYFGAKGVKQSVYQFSLPAAQMARARSAQTVSLQTGNGARYTFTLSDMSALLDDVRNCTGELQQSWNMDGKNLRTAEVPVGDIRSVFTAKDYPAEALRRQQQGTTQYQLLVDDKGAVARCDVLVSSGLVTLDSTGCQVIQQKAKFRPAVDLQGKAVRSVWTTPPVTWSSASNPLNGGCTMVSSDSNTLLNTCGRTPGDRIQGMQPVPTGIPTTPVTVPSPH